MGRVVIQLARTINHEICSSVRSMGFYITIFGNHPIVFPHFASLFSITSKSSGETNITRTFHPYFEVINTREFISR